MKITIGSYVLFDSTVPGAALSNFTPDFQRAIQIVEPTRGDEIETINRGLKRCNFGFTISRQHTSEDAVMDFLAFHERDIPMGGVIKITGRSPTGSERNAYYAGHVMSGRGHHVGVRSFFDYTIVTGASHKSAAEASS
jgi:hypothetical protein